MARLFKTETERKKGLWRRAVGLALTDVRVAADGLDHASLEALEERLLAADFGVATTMRLIDHVEDAARRGKVRGAQELLETLRGEIATILGDGSVTGLTAADDGPTVYLFVGVNGVGKTTSVAKLAHRLVTDGRSVLLAAADTFRAGATEQLEVWSGRIGTDFVKGRDGGDPAAVAFDAVEAAAARGCDAVLIDTAGRLHTNPRLMAELSKIERVIGRQVEGAPHETLLVLDATVGQNAVRQMEAFGDALAITGIVLAKTDSSARGGIIVGLREEHGTSVKLVGTGEGLDDLDVFDPDQFVEELFAS